MQLPPPLKGCRDELNAALAIPVPGAWDEEISFAEAEQPGAIAQVLIEALHEDLASAKIAYLFREQMTRRDRIRLGTASKASSKLHFLTEFDFLIEFNWSAWLDLSVEQRIALVDHELCHCALDAESEKWVLKHHDVEEFGSIVRRWGLWQPDLERFGRDVKAALQGSLFEGEAATT